MVGQVRLGMVGLRTPSILAGSMPYLIYNYHFFKWKIFQAFGIVYKA